MPSKPSTPIPTTTASQPSNSRMTVKNKIVLEPLYQGKVNTKPETMNQIEEIINKETSKRLTPSGVTIPWH